MQLGNKKDNNRVKRTTAVCTIVFNIALIIATVVIVHIRDVDTLSPVHAMNVGIAAATGDYVAILEPDDYYDTGFLDRAISVAREFDADVVKTKFWEHSEETGTDSLSDPLGDLPMMKPIEPQNAVFFKNSRMIPPPHIRPSVCWIDRT